MDTRPRYRVPDELRETLLDFTIAYLLERPANLPAFGLGFFNKLIEQQGRGAGAGIKKNSNNGTTTGTSGGGAGNQEQQQHATTDENEGSRNTTTTTIGRGITGNGTGSSQQQQQPTQQPTTKVHGDGGVLPVNAAGNTTGRGTGGSGSRSGSTSYDHDDGGNGSLPVSGSGGPSGGAGGSGGSGSGNGSGGSGAGAGVVVVVGGGSGGGPSSGSGSGGPSSAGGSGGSGPSSGSGGGVAGVPPKQEIITDDTNNQPPAPLRSVTRRKSVFAETYNPEDDDDDDLNLIVHPKSDEQRIRLAEAVKNILLFRSLDAEQMQQVLDAMFERKVVNNEFVITQGEDGDNFYIIESGIYPVYVSPEDPPKLPTTNTKPVFTYMNSGSFGELALMYNMPRAATVQAQGNNCSLWAMDRTTFRKIILKSAFKKRQMYESLLEQVPMLKGLENYERLNLADALVPRSYSSSDIIIRQGDVADGMYFVEDGTVRITRLDSNGEEKELTRCSKGGYFGELALLTSSPRAATVEAIGNVKLAFLDVDAFERLLGPCMELMKRNAEDYEKQLLLLFGSTSNITHMR